MAFSLDAESGRNTEIWKSLAVDVSSSVVIGTILVLNARSIYLHFQLDTLTGGTAPTVLATLKSAGNTEGGANTAPATTQFALLGATSALDTAVTNEGVGSVSFSPWVEVSVTTTGTPATATGSFWVTVRK